MSYKVDEEIEGMARVTKIERKKLTFINLNNRMPEYIEIPEDAVLNFGLQQALAPQPGNSVIDQRGRYDFAIRRTDLEKAAPVQWNRQIVWHGCVLRQAAARWIAARMR